MPRPHRSFAAGTSYHVTMRCNNQAFDIRRPQARKVILFCLSKAQAKFDFQLSGLCVMSNRVHYLIRPARPEQMPRLMHWLNWYSAMLLNRLLHRRGHFWEQRYHAVAVPDHDTGHALRVLRYIHANPKAAGMIAGFDYAYSNYRSYVRPAEDGLTAWHPAYLRLGPTLEACARRYEYFCRRYKAEARAKKRSEWGGWQLWYDIAVKPAGQGDLFGGTDGGKPGASYHGGANPKRQALSVAALRPAVLAEVERFIQINQP